MLFLLVGFIQCFLRSLSSGYRRAFLVVFYKLAHLVFLTTLFSSESYAQERIPDLKTILERGSVIVGVCKIDQPPFYSRDKNGVLKGIDIDIANGIAEGLGVKLVIDESAENWDALIEQLKKGQIDLAISFLSTTAQRAKYILFSQPYTKINQSLLVNRLRLQQAIAKGQKNLESLFAEGSKEEIVTYEGSAYIRFAQKLFKDAKLATYKTNTEIINNLIAGKHLAFISDQIEVKTFIDRHPEAKLELIPLNLKKDFDLIAVGIAPGNHALQQFVDRYLQINGISIEFANIPRISESHDIHLEDLK